MKKITKVVSVILAVMFAMTAMACFASAETTTTVKCNCCLNSTDSAGDTITQFQGPRDIYLVLDISGSMSGTPIARLKEAAKQFCATMIDDKTGDNRIAVVTYNTNVETVSFTSDYAALANTIDNFTAKGSTAMYDALMAVKEINEKLGNPDASKHVVVMADGLPNEGAVITSGKYTSKDSTMYYKHGNAVYSTAAGMWHEFNIYSIGFFHNLGGSQLRFGKTLMKDIQNALYLEVFDPDKLLDAFNGVADNILGDCANGCDPACNCDTCDCGGDCQCSPSCKCYDRHNGNNNDNNNNNNNNTDNQNPETTTAPTTKVPDSITQTGDSSVAITAAAVIMLAGIAVVATRKRED